MRHQDAHRHADTAAGLRRGLEPVIVPKRKRRLDGIDEIVLSLTARGLTTGEIAAHFNDV